MCIEKYAGMDVCGIRANILQMYLAVFVDVHVLVFSVFSCNTPLVVLLLYSVFQCYLNNPTNSKSSSCVLFWSALRDSQGLLIGGLGLATWSSSARCSAHRQSDKNAACPCVLHNRDIMDPLASEAAVV